jgi:hypothetical protein
MILKYHIKSFQPVFTIRCLVTAPNSDRSSTKFSVDVPWWRIWTVLLPSDTLRKLITSVTDALLPFVTYLLTFSRSLRTTILGHIHRERSRASFFAACTFMHIVQTLSVHIYFLGLWVTVPFGTEQDYLAVMSQTYITKVLGFHRSLQSRCRS